MTDAEPEQKVYRLSPRTTGEFDLAVDVILLDEQNEDIDAVYETDTVEDARAWVERQGGIVRESKCLHCGNVQIDLWAECEVCGSPALVATDSVTERALFLGRIREKLAKSITCSTGLPDRALDGQLERMFGHKTVGENARYLSTDITHTLTFLAEALPGWSANFQVRGDAIILARSTANPMAAHAGVFPGVSDIRVSAVNAGGYEATGCNLSMALLDAIFQALIAAEVSQHENRQSD